MTELSTKYREAAVARVGSMPKRKGVLTAEGFAYALGLDINTPITSEMLQVSPKVFPLAETKNGLFQKVELDLRGSNQIGGTNVLSIRAYMGIAEIAEHSPQNVMRVIDIEGEATFVRYEHGHWGAGVRIDSVEVLGERIKNLNSEKAFAAIHRAAHPQELFFDRLDAVRILHDGSAENIAGFSLEDFLKLEKKERSKFHSPIRDENGVLSFTKPEA